jgi:glycosyltransferase involved in cell wall biosynthesis
VSVLLPTRRPGRVAQAVATVAAQRAPGLELVLACHGHPVEQSRLRELAGPDLDAVVLQAPGDLPFGQLLNRAAAMASGDLLLKMDDDDWYGPDFVTDLLLARGYSGADVVGTPPEFLYLEQLDLTVRRRDATERFRPVVAGGTMLIGREALAAVGGFRSMRRYVDAALLQGVLAAGGSVYRTHGHDYVLRRGGEGHTWDPGLGYFVSRSRTLQQWRGFRPSPLIGPLIGPVSAR